MRRSLMQLAGVGVIAAVCLAGLASWAWADSDLRVRVGTHQEDARYYYGWDWQWGDPVLDGTLRFSRNGLALVYRNGNWGSSYRSGVPYGTHPNDRPGYRAFIPRGLQEPPQYYGDAANAQPPQYIYPGCYQPWGYGRQRAGYPLVIDYSYGNAWGRPALVYTAPSCPEYGYTRPSWSERQPASPYYDNRTYNNYYYGDNAGQENAGGREAAPQQVVPPSALPQPAPPADFVGPVRPATPPAAPAAPAQPAGKPYGMRFYDKTRLATSEGAYSCVLDGGKLYGALADGKLAEISASADMRFGAFALYETGTGFSVIFRDGQGLAAAYPSSDKKWWVEPLPYAVDFSQDTSLGMMGSAAWVVFSSPDGTRYVISYSGRQWSEVGSGTRPAER